MKQLIIAIMIMSSLSGCKALNGMRWAQPNDLDYWKPNQDLFNIEGAEIIIRAPVKRTTALDGSVIETPIMKKVTKHLENGETIITEEPVLVNFRVKDTAAKPPTTAWDVTMALGKVGLAAYLGGEAFAVMEAISTMKSRDPIVVTNETASLDVVLPDDGFTVDRD